MPHSLSPLVVAATVAEIVGLLFVAAILRGLQQTFPRPHTSAWSWSWIAGALAALGGILAATLPPLAPFSRWALSFAILLAYYLQAAWLIVGTRLLTRGTAAEPRLRRVAVTVPVLLALASTVLPASAMPLALRTLVRFALPTAALSLAALATAFTVWRRPAPATAVGTRLMAGALFLYGLRRTHDLAIYALMTAGAPLPGYPVYLGFLDLAMLTALGLGSVVSLLEEEREQLRFSEQKFARVFRNSPDAIVVSLPLEGGRVVDVNERFEAITGFSRDEAVGRTTVELGIFRDEAERRAFLGDPPKTRFRDRELELVVKGGERRVLSLAADSFEFDGRTYAVTIARDVTDRVAMLEQLRRARVMEAMGSLVAGVAHEVRNPLFSISATVDAMEAGSRAQRDSSGPIARLRSQVERLSRLMADLLDYGKPPQLQPAPTSLAGLVERAARSCAALSDERQVRVQLAVDKNLPALEVDGVRVEQVFENLIANAVQHAPAGSVVSVGARLDARRTPACVRCTVEDQGPGVAEDERTRIFEPFFTRRRGGTGLGLSIVQRVVEAHGGEVTAGLRPGGGGCFTVWLPVAAPAAAARRPD